ncbi:MAG: hypothetical protein A2Z88_11155 [Omnitrophica WOR_2 bacterium GWA2_47_8]|nr:MAG: hypothetical protein A2Z88_11155 [Omnitrophica WOR_2 bacterium GWA2_47_8]
MKTNGLSKSFDILNSAIFFTVLAFLLDIIYFSDLRQAGPLFSAACAALKVILYGGLLGVLVELASEEEAVITIRNFKKNLKNHWLLYFLCISLEAFLQASVAKLLNAYFGTAPSFQIFYFSPLISCLLALILIQQKYLRPRNLPGRPVTISPLQGGVIVLFFFSENIFKNIHLFLPPELSFLQNLFIIGAIYLNLFTFVYLAVLILRAYPEIEEGFDKERKLYLINPLSGGIISGLFTSFVRSYPPVFAILRALSPKSYKTREFNRYPWRNYYYKPGKLVAITSFTSNIAEAYKIAKEFRKHGSKVIMGGPHVTYHPQEALDFCDSVVVGEVEGIWKDIIKDFENGTLKAQYVGPAVEDFHSEVHKELLTYPPEIIKDCIEATRGCKFHCDFCTIPSISGGRTRHKPIHEIVELIEKVTPFYRDINIIDNNIYSNPAYARELFKALKPLNIRWSTASTIDIVKNEETLKLAKESGCKMFLFGYEIFGGSLETKQRGKFALSDHYIEFTKKIKEAGIKIKGTFIFGFDSDNFGNLFKLWRFCFSIYPYFTNLGILTPLPGSRLYHQMLDENRTTNLNWRNYDCHQLVFKHNNLRNSLVQKSLPFIKYFFLLTTSQFGNFILALLVVGIVMSAR